jgi:hypothetical protein
MSNEIKKINSAGKTAIKKDSGFLYTLFRIDIFHVVIFHKGFRTQT